MSAPGATAGGPSLALVFGLLLVFVTPQWALLLWVARSPQQRLGAAGRSTSIRLLSATVWVAAVALGAIGSLWVNNALIGRHRVELYRLVNAAALGQLFLLGVAMFYVVYRARAASAPPVPPAPPAGGRPSPRALWIVLVAWVVAAGVAAALALGPLAGRPAEAHAWRALALAAVVIATMVVLLVRATRGTGRSG